MNKKSEMRRIKKILNLAICMISIISIFDINLVFSQVSSAKSQSISRNTNNNLNQRTGLKDISINTLTNFTSINDVFPGIGKKEFIDDKIIKFEINCDNNRKIRITRLNESENPDIKLNVEWKSGPFTGFETPYTDGVYTPENGKFYITVRLKSVNVSPMAKKGFYQFSPSILVEYFGM
jgi:hypothetical protein